MGNIAARRPLASPGSSAVGGGVAHRAGHPGISAEQGLAALNTNAIAARPGWDQSPPSLPQQGGDHLPAGRPGWRRCARRQEAIRSRLTAGPRPLLLDEALEALDALRRVWGAVAGGGSSSRPLHQVEQEHEGRQIAFWSERLPLWLPLARARAHHPGCAISTGPQTWAKQCTRGGEAGARCGNSIGAGASSWWRRHRRAGSWRGFGGLPGLVPAGPGRENTERSAIFGHSSCLNPVAELAVAGQGQPLVADGSAAREIAGSNWPEPAAMVQPRVPWPVLSQSPGWGSGPQGACRPASWGAARPEGGLLEIAPGEEILTTMARIVASGLSARLKPEFGHAAHPIRLSKWVMRPCRSVQHGCYGAPRHPSSAG